ncbi:hypothetical protein LINPERPRIM_LOCUS32773 [Linum perenne]
MRGYLKDYQRLLKLWLSKLQFGQRLLPKPLNKTHAGWVLIMEGVLLMLLGILAQVDGLHLTQMVLSKQTLGKLQLGVFLGMDYT